MSFGGAVVWYALISLLVGSLVGGRPSPVQGETITRRHLDAGYVHFSGMDLNGDGIQDAISQDNVRKRLTYFFGDTRRDLRRVDPLGLPEEDRRFLPDMLVEQDLDGDDIRDLLLFNSEFVKKYTGNQPVFMRILGDITYIGQGQDIYQALRGCDLTPEARQAILEKTREIVLRNLQ